MNSARWAHFTVASKPVKKNYDEEHDEPNEIMSPIEDKYSISN